MSSGNEKYTIGVDFGTLSARALLVRVSDGREIGSTVMEYPHAVMDDYLDTPKGKIKLPPNWALEHPSDYIYALQNVIPGVVAQTGISPDDIIGIAIDFTTCTLLPVKKDGTPLCLTEEFSCEPHAYVKLWKHHAAQKYANMLSDIAEERGETWLSRYGGRISSEWMFPKIWETLDCAPAVYNAADFFIDAADWMVWQLTGIQTRNSCIAGYKAEYVDGQYPSQDFFRALDTRLENVVADKCGAPVVSVGGCAGYLTAEAASLLGLHAGIAVAPGNADAHCAAPAGKISRSGDMLAIMGTSTCMLLVSDEYHEVPGICGAVKDGIIPGMYGYEAGLGCVGDHFAWSARTCMSPEYIKEADESRTDYVKFLADKMALLRPGESGLLALDWWNGNRSILVDTDLSGMILGMSLNTKPEEIFRALVEATAFGSRMIIENYREHGIEVRRLTAGGGIPRKGPATMQLYADVLNMEIHVAGSAQCPALGSAIFAACAAGSKAGGYDSYAEASEAMGSVSDVVYTPIPENTAVYDELYAEYRVLHDYFGRGGNNVMKKLLDMKSSFIK